MEKCLFAMFGFFHGSIHVFMEFSCDDNNNITNEIYQVPFFEKQGLHWFVTTCRYRIIRI
jgi:hypothetical protein